MTMMFTQEQVDAKIAVALQSVMIEVAELKTKVLSLTAAVNEAKDTIAMYRQMMFGTKSERSQVILPVEGQQYIDPNWHVGINVTPAPKETLVEEVPGTSTVHRERDRRGLAQRHPHLPIQVVEAPVAAEILHEVESGKALVQRGQRYCDELVIPNEKPFIRRTYSMEVVHPVTSKTLIELPPSDRIVPGGVLADETIHALVIAKFLDAIPFFRTLESWKRMGIDISRQVVNDVFAQWAELFDPLTKQIIDEILHAPVVHSDESWARLQAKKKCDKVNIWTLVGGEQVAYIYTPDRTHAQVHNIIPKWFKGYLIRDEWQGWQKLTDIKQAGCNAHARRPYAAFIKIDPNNSDAKSIIELYRQIYAFEHLANEGPPEGILDRRREIRREKSSPIMDKIRSEAERISKAYDFNNPLAEGSRYIIKHFKELTKFLSDPMLPPDNNAAEGALRINALIRKNSLFFGSEDGGKRAACALTILHSCKFVGIEPNAYLAHVTPTLLLHRSGRKVDLTQLTPLAIAGSGILPVQK